jgi:nucleoside-diphosphate-sugar epimerase
MTVFVAGGSGAIGIPLVRALVSAGHRVTALTRSTSKRETLRNLGATVAVADALDREALMGVVEAARPTHVIHQLTALPKGGPRRPSDLDATNRLRIEGTRNLLEAAVNAGARRLVAGSFAMLSARGSATAVSKDDEAAAAVRSMEAQVLEASRRGAIEGVILRYGMFYGLETSSTLTMIDMVRKRRLPVVRGGSGQLPLIHIDDAVSATVRALDMAPAGSTYDIVDDHPASLAEIVETIAELTGSSAPRRVPAWLPRLFAPYMARLLSLQMRLSNEAARAELGWRPKYSTLRDGLAGIFHRPA